MLRFWILVLGISTFLYILGVTVYRVTLHPLAKYPGPLLAKITDWYSVYHLSKGDSHLNFYEAHQKYGRFVRFGPNRISVNSNTALRDIYGFKANVQKSRVYKVFADYMGGFNVHLTINKAQHGRKKRVLSQALSDSAMKGMEEHILKIVRRFCDHLLDRGVTEEESKGLTDHKRVRDWSSAKNMADWTHYLSFDVMGALCFGKSFGMLEREHNRYILEVLIEATQGLHTVSKLYSSLLVEEFLIHGFQMAHMPGLLKLHLTEILFRKLDQDMGKFKAYCKAQTDERIKNDADIKVRDFYSYLLKARDPETGIGFSENELSSETGLLMVAGSDTTSVALAATVFYLLHNHHTLEKLNTEIRSTFDDVEAIRSGAQLNSCQYLRACIDEAMRCSPSVGGIMPREVLAGGINIDGHDFPEGVEIGTPHYALHHNEAYFPKPFDFKPSRWLAGSEEGVVTESVELARSAFCAFSSGPRGCMGRGMAYMEISIALARVVWLYDMQLAKGSKLGEGASSFPKGRRRKGEYQLVDAFASKADGPLVEFSARLP
ncbi:MAG: hypothetical protein M1830_006166 [Pleopsidium flavum]|nr:MAG: hypothetical protein M1830_006166 [Pleopsidium flavum]